MRQHLTPMVFLLSLISALASAAGWEGEVFYQVFPRSFRDSNGDRIGDLKGIRQGLVAIKKLGATAILLNPIQRSRVYHNYFPDDFYSVDPAFGTLKDFRELIAAAHRQHIKLVLDMEQQYVADGHPWFKTMTADPNRDTPFLWRKNRMDMWDKVAWYNGAKVRVSPVNLNNPAVRKELIRVFQFWADQGVDGFRLDHMMDDLDGRHVQTHLFANFWTPLEKAVRAKHPRIFFIAEQADWKSDGYIRQILRATPTDAVFAFPLKEALLNFDKSKIELAMNHIVAFVKAGKTELTFLENHDTERFASFESDERKRRLAAALLMTLKGTPSIYQGQELGMRGIQGHGLTDGNDIPVRLAYRWTSKVDGPGTAIWYRNTGPWWSTAYSRDNDGISYQEEDRQPASLLNWYRDLIHLRLRTPALRTGSQSLLMVSDPQILAFERRGGSERIVVYANLSDTAKTVPLSGSFRRVWPQPGQLSRSLRLAPYELAVVRR